MKIFECALLNISCTASSISEDLLDNHILKESAFSAKYKTPVLSYEYILLPITNADMNDQDFLYSINVIKTHLSGSVQLTDDILYSIYLLFGGKVLESNFEKLKGLSIDVFRIIDETQINIIYSDGSSSARLNAAGYGCCILTEMSNASTAAVDNFTSQSWDYITISGKINDGTNNIGELSGIKAGLENMLDKSYQIIISDSIYAIKSFREYIHVWKNNGYKTYSKKEIKNKDLICETYSKLQDVQKNKFVLFKWTKGHANDTFNEECDRLAKEAVGIKDE